MEGEKQVFSRDLTCIWRHLYPAMDHGKQPVGLSHPCGRVSRILSKGHNTSFVLISSPPLLSLHGGDLWPAFLVGCE